VLAAIVLSSIVEAVLNAAREVPDAVLDIMDHALIALLLVSDLDAFFLEPLGAVQVFGSSLNLLTCQGSSSLLHHGLCTSLESV
jgi:hypothetical protein